MSEDSPAQGCLELILCIPMWGNNPGTDCEKTWKSSTCDNFGNLPQRIIRVVPPSTMLESGPTLLFSKPMLICNKKNVKKRFWSLWGHADSKNGKLFANNWVKFWPKNLFQIKTRTEKNNKFGQNCEQRRIKGEDCRPENQAPWGLNSRAGFSFCLFAFLLFQLFAIIIILTNNAKRKKILLRTKDGHFSFVTPFLFFSACCLFDNIARTNKKQGRKIDGEEKRCPFQKGFLKAFLEKYSQQCIFWILTLWNSCERHLNYLKKWLEWIYKMTWVTWVKIFVIWWICEV